MGIHRRGRMLGVGNMWRFKEAAMGSGNYLEDQEDWEQERDFRAREVLECGCFRRCTCDDGDEEGL